MPAMSGASCALLSLFCPAAAPWGFHRTASQHGFMLSTTLPPSPARLAVLGRKLQGRSAAASRCCRSASQRAQRSRGGAASRASLPPPACPPPLFFPLPLLPPPLVQLLPVSLPPAAAGFTAGPVYGGASLLPGSACAVAGAAAGPGGAALS